MRRSSLSSAQTWPRRSSLASTWLPFDALRVFEACLLEPPRRSAVFEDSRGLFGDEPLRTHTHALFESDAGAARALCVSCPTFRPACAVQLHAAWPTTKPAPPAGGARLHCPHAPLPQHLLQHNAVRRRLARAARPAAHASPRPPRIERPRHGHRRRQEAASARRRVRHGRYAARRRSTCAAACSACGLARGWRRHTPHVLPAHRRQPLTPATRLPQARWWRACWTSRRCTAVVRPTPFQPRPIAWR